MTIPDTPFDEETVGEAIKHRKAFFKATKRLAMREELKFQLPERGWDPRMDSLIDVIETLIDEVYK